MTAMRRCDGVVVVLDVHPAPFLFMVGVFVVCCFCFFCFFFFFFKK